MNSTLPIHLPRHAEAAQAAHAPRHSAGATGQIGHGSAHAKAILFGEHAVVYGAPAITIPVFELEATARVDACESGVRIESELFSGEVLAAPAQLAPIVAAIRASLAHVGDADAHVRVQILSAIPHSRGLGSSAAVAAAVARGVADWAGTSIDTAELYDIVQQAERIAHGNPSGLDARAVTSDGTFRFDLGVVTPLNIGAPLSFVLADTGIAGSTAEAVGGVRARRVEQPERIDALITRLAEIAEESVVHLAAADKHALGASIHEAHQLLDQIGVSSPELNALVSAAEAAGALGAKLTGGGLGGCILALAHSEEHAEQLATALRAAGAPRTWTATVPAT